MGRPPSDLDDYLDWQERLESFKASGLSLDEFCLREGVSRSTYYRWVDQLKDGIPKEMVAEKAAQEKAANHPVSGTRVWWGWGFIEPVGSPEFPCEVFRKAEAFSRCRDRYAKDNVDHLGFLLQLAELEPLEREKRANQRRLKAAQVPQNQDLGEVQTDCWLPIPQATRYPS